MNKSYIIEIYKGLKKIGTLSGNIFFSATEKYIMISDIYILKSGYCLKCSTIAPKEMHTYTKIVYVKDVERIQDCFGATNQLKVYVYSESEYEKLKYNKLKINKIADILSLLHNVIVILSSLHKIWKTFVK